MTPRSWFHFEHGSLGRPVWRTGGFRGRGIPDGKPGARRRPPKPIAFRMDGR